MTEVVATAQRGTLPERSVDLPAEPVSAGRARRFVGAALRNWSIPAVQDDAILLTSELVTNALLHSASDHVHLRLVLLPDAVRVEVGDESAAVPRPRHYGHDAATGRGLAMVAAAARSWGTVPSGHGKTVWFELATD